MKIGGRRVLDCRELSGLILKQVPPATQCAAPEFRIQESEFRIKTRDATTCYLFMLRRCKRLKWASPKTHRAYALSGRNEFALRTALFRRFAAHRAYARCLVRLTTCFLFTLCRVKRTITLFHRNQPDL
jgi:hypothetical protein